MRSQSEVLGAVVLALVLASTLTVFALMHQRQVDALRSLGEAARILAERRAEAIVFDYFNGSIYASPSISIGVLYTVVYNSTHVVYSNATPYALAPGSWRKLDSMPSGVAQLVVEGLASLALLTNTGSLVTWVPPVTRVEGRTVLVEEVPRAGLRDAWAFNDSRLLYLTYDHGYYAYKSSTGCPVSRFFNANTPVASMIVFYSGSPAFSEAFDSKAQGSSSSIVQNFTVSSGGGYLKVSYKWESSSVGTGLRRLLYAESFSIEAEGLTQAGRALVLALLENALAYMYATKYMLPDGSTVLPLLVYADGGLVSGAAAYAKIIVVEPVSQSNATVTVELFRVKSENLEVIEVFSKPIAIAVVDEASSFISRTLAPAPAVVITHVSSAGYALYSSPPIGVEYSRSSGAISTTVDSSAWSFSIDDPWISYGSFQNRWTTATVKVAVRSVEVQVTAASWQSIEKYCSTPPLIQSNPPQPTPPVQPPPPPPAIYAILDPMPINATPITVDVYVVSSRAEADLSIKYRVVDEEAGQAIEGDASFSYVNTPLGVKWGVKLTLPGDAKRRVEVWVLYSSSVIAGHLYRNYVP